MQMRYSALFLLSACLPVAIAHARTPVCSSADDSHLRASEDTCLQAHVFDVVTVPGGTRFLDLCSPDVSDSGCRFSVVSYPADARQVGDLEAVRGKDISIRGAVQNYNGRYVLVLNDQRQLRGGAARFAPDPRLFRSTSAEDAAGNIPQLRVNFHHRGKKLEKE
jgi:hypothetical protein